MDVEQGDARPDGYPTLAKWIARDPDSDTFVFRKFSELDARILLDYQAELMTLQSELNEQDKEASGSKDFKSRQASRRWETLTERAKVIPDGLEARRVETMRRIKVLLKDYYETILLSSQITSLSRPKPQSLVASRAIVNGEFLLDSGGNPVPLISGEAQAYLNDKSDLVALACPGEEDHLSRILQQHWIPRNHSKQKARDQGQIPTQESLFTLTSIYKNTHITRTVALLDLLLAALLLIGAIVNLYFVINQAAKLGLIALYTMLFAASVTLCTNARRAEVFAATAAYAAVLVVFVSGDLGGGGVEGAGEQCLIQLEGAIWKVVKCPG